MSVVPEPFGEAPLNTEMPKSAILTLLFLSIRMLSALMSLFMNARE